MSIFDSPEASKALAEQLQQTAVADAGKMDDAFYQAGVTEQLAATAKAARDQVNQDAQNLANALGGANSGGGNTSLNSGGEDGSTPPGSGGNNGGGSSPGDTATGVGTPKAGDGTGNPPAGTITITSGPAALGEPGDEPTDPVTSPESTLPYFYIPSDDPPATGAPPTDGTAPAADEPIPAPLVPADPGGGYVPPTDGGEGQGEKDPLVIDVSGNGLNLEARSLTTPYFDFSGNGMASHTAWIGAGTGFLAIAGADGLVDNGSDLIDTFTQLQALAANNDGVIDASDPIFSKLVVWEDLNGDGVCQADEVFTLAQLGIVSISVNTNAADAVINGSTVVETATATMADGTTREIAQVELNVSPTYTEYVGPQSISADAALLPEVQGYGTLMDLQHAMSADPQLLSDVQALLTVDPGSTAAFDTAVQTVLYEWAGVESLASNSRGKVFDGQKLGFLEALTGQPYRNAMGWTNPAFVSAQGVPLDQSWNTAFSGVKARLLVQNPASTLSSDFAIIQNLDYVVPFTDYTTTINNIAQQAPLGSQALPFWIDALTVLSESISDVQQVIPLDSAEIATALEAAAPSVLAPSLLSAVASGQMTYVDASPVGAGSPDGSTVYVTSNDLVYVTAPEMTIDVSGDDNEFIVPTGVGTLTIDATQVSPASPNVLYLAAGFSEATVTVSGDGSGGIYLTDATTGDQIDLGNELGNSQSGVQQVQFADGTVWSGQQLQALADTEKVYVLAPGIGHLTASLFDGILVVSVGAGIAASDVALQADNRGDLTIGLRDDTADSILIEGDLYGSDGVQSRLSSLVLADGSTINLNNPTFTWTATASDTTLIGSNWGPNVFDLAPGGDTVTFGNGQYEYPWTVWGEASDQNSVYYNAGDGAVTINLNGGPGAIYLGPGIIASELTYAANDSAGDLTINIGNSGDSILIESDLYSYCGVQSRLSSLVLADGSTISLNNPTFTWTATASDTTLIGSNWGPNVFDLAPGGDTVTFGNGQYEYPWTVWGEASDQNSVYYNAGDGAVTINLNGGPGTIYLGPGITASEVLLQTDNAGDLKLVLADDPADSITLTGDLMAHWWGVSSQIGQVTFADGTTLTLGQSGYGSAPMVFTWNGTTTNAMLTGSNYGSNVFNLGPGGDTVTGGNTALLGGDINGTNTYNFARGDGQVTINPNGASGTLNFAPGLDETDLWFAQNGSNLVVDAIGTPDSVTVKGWFGANTSSPLGEIVGGDGLKIDAQVNQLVAAMATFQANNAGFNPLVATQMPSNASLQNALAAAWHH